VVAALALLYALIHPSAWNRNSAKFAFWGFCEVRSPLGSVTVVVTLGRRHYCRVQSCRKV
jgi:hypothetical protein